MGAWPRRWRPPGLEYIVGGGRGMAGGREVAITPFSSAAAPMLLHVAPLVQVSLPLAVSSGGCPSLSCDDT